MGRLVPEGFALSSLKNDSERIVVRALCDQLSDGWVVLPSVGFSSEQRDYELDVVIAHERDGIAVIEVKGHRPEIKGGIWYSGRDPMKPQPFAQARDNAYELRRQLRRRHPSLANLDLEYAVAFPNVAKVRGELPSDIDASQVLISSTLDDVTSAIDRLLTRRYGQRQLGAIGVSSLVELVRPDVQFEYDPEVSSRLARMRLDTICEQQVRALEGLDINRRVCVTGAAGTGKTRLAMAWTRRALLRGERVLLTCFNEPLAEILAGRMPDVDDVRIGPFWRVAFDLDGMPELAEPEGVDQRWWDEIGFGHLRDHWGSVTERFDTIVIDEGQDFSPTWIELLEQLLDPNGPRRLLIAADESQGIYGRGFRAPSPDDGWTRCHLESNCRNTFAIANLLRHRFGGAQAPIGGPESEDLTWIEVASVDEAIEATGEAIDVVLDDRDHTAASVLVATCTRSVRDRIRSELGCSSFEQASDLDVVCETVHRVKGLEYDHVILVVHDRSVPDDVLYVGISRAVISLTIIGPSAVGSRLGLSAAQH